MGVPLCLVININLEGSRMVKLYVDHMKYFDQENPESWLVS